MASDINILPPHVFVTGSNAYKSIFEA